MSARAPQAAKVGFETGPLAAWHWHELKDGSNAVQVDQLIAQSAAVQDAHLSQLRANEIEAAEKVRPRTSEWSRVWTPSASGSSPKP